ncbi:MAG: polysaccharide deacetylase family protein [Candidatus Portnoybacteria bacterium]|nr:polysaccharide deacetylase family protein [Candidatus Portnoybacteria bacterium]
MKQKAILTFDLEFWYNSKFLKKYLAKDKNHLNDFIKESVLPLLDILKKHQHQATFFVLGELAEKYPDLIRKIKEAGYEIASHGLTHRPLDELNEISFKDEIVVSKKTIKDITGEEPKGFRAPNFSLKKNYQWSLKILGNEGFRYDSSIHPLSLRRVSGPIKEVYSSLGGIYFRILPLSLYLFLVKFFSKEKLPVLYFHPYELFESSPKIKSGPWIKRKIKYWGTKTAWKKFEKLMNRFNFISIRQYLESSD